jgi:anti-sigma regulatory factor (Ser/Thr protein kinase)
MSAPSLPASIGRLRRFAVAQCQEHGWRGNCDTIALLVSELATNALIHGDGDVGLHVVADAVRVRVEVSDASDVLPADRHRGALAEGGRGIGLLESLSDVWGVDRLSPQGKAVWFELAS